MNFNNISGALGLGELKAPAERVYGGLMHSMYRMVTDKGRYAVKLLNPEIMKRPDVFENYRIAEGLENKLQEAGIPIVPALEFTGSKMQCINGQYFYIFNWVCVYESNGTIKMRKSSRRPPTPLSALSCRHCEPSTCGRPVHCV